MSSVHIRTWLALRWLLPAVWRKISDFMHNISFCEFLSDFLVNFLVLIWSLLMVFSKRKESYKEISLLKIHPKLDKKFIKTDSVHCSHTYRESLSISNYSVSWSQSNAYFGQFFIVNLHRRVSEYTHSTVDGFDRNFSIHDRMISNKNKNVICKLLFSKTQGSMKKKSIIWATMNLKSF